MAFVAPRDGQALLLDADAVNGALEAFGRALYNAGRPRKHFSETILAAVDRRRTLRRLVSQAWDLERSWHAVEPDEHRLAMPSLALLAFVATALGWKAGTGPDGPSWRRSLS